MNRWLLVIGYWLLVISYWPAFEEPGPRTTNQEQITNNNFAVIISGAGGDPIYTKRFTTWTDTMYGLLHNQLGYPEDQIFYLSATPSDLAHRNTAKATAEAVRSVFGQLQSQTRPQSRIFIFLVGHGSFGNQQAKFNLVGPDLTADDFNHMLDALPAKKVILVNTASASGPFINAISQPGRVILTATRSGQEQNATMFAEFFIQAFKDTQADLDKNHRVSMFEAFTYATKLTEQWYQQEGRLATEHALLDDNGDKIGHNGASEGDGALAQTVYLDAALAVSLGDPALQKLTEEKERLEHMIEELKARKAKMNATEYEAELERLLIQLARVNQQIKAQ